MPGSLTATLQDALNARLNEWSARFGPNFILGLSGGGDSMALALGCAQWNRSGQGRVTAICVDHGLRDGSAQEARQTRVWAQTMGLDCQIVSLNLARGQSRLQERARESRHHALLEAAKSHRARIILLAHNQDDQRETLAMRLASKTGLDGLAGMAALSPSPFYSDDWPCLIGRPLLDVPREHLRLALTKVDQAWHEDPSNESCDFARIRTRKRLKALSQLGADLGILDAIAKHSRRLRAARDDAAHQLLTDARLSLTNQGALLGFEALSEANPSVGERVLSWLSFTIGASARVPDSIKTSRLNDAIKSPDFKGATLAGARFQRRQNAILVTPAPLRKGQKGSALRINCDFNLRLAAVCGDLDQFVTHLG